VRAPERATALPVGAAALATGRGRCLPDGRLVGDVGAGATWVSVGTAMRGVLRRLARSPDARAAPAARAPARRGEACVDDAFVVAVPAGEAFLGDDTLVVAALDRDAFVGDDLVGADFVVADFLTGADFVVADFLAGADFVVAALSGVAFVVRGAPVDEAISRSFLQPRPG
jgi:hypothetical protein